MKIGKFLSLPLHHIDTSVLIEPEKTEDGKYCRKYLQLIGYKYKWVLSFPVLSEILGVLRFIAHLRKYKKVVFYSPKKVFAIAEELSSLDRRLQPVDMNIIATAIEHKAANLVTLDRQVPLPPTKVGGFPLKENILQLYNFYAPCIHPTTKVMGFLHRALIFMHAIPRSSRGLCRR